MNCNFHYCSKVILIFLQFSIFLSLLSPLKAQTQYDFRLKLEKGQSFVFYTATDQSSSQQIAGKKETITQSIVSRDLIEVKDKLAGNYWVDVTRKSCSYETSDRYGTLTYDSEESTTSVPDPAVGYAMLVGCTFHLKMNDKGEILEIIDLAESLATISQNLKEMMPNISAALIDQIKASMTKESIQEGFAPLGRFFPPKKIAIGESWNKKLAAFEGFPVKVNTEYLLQRVEELQAQIVINSSFKKEEHAQHGDMDMFEEFKGKQEGSARINLANGLIYDSSIEQSASAMVNNPRNSSEKTLIVFTSKTRAKVED